MKVTNIPKNINKKKQIPKFSKEAEEREFWQKSDSTEYIDWKKAKSVTFENLRPSTKVISLRLPENLLNDLKKIAHKMDVPYQSLIKVFLSEKMEERYKYSYTPKKGKKRPAKHRSRKQKDEHLKTA